MGRKYSGAGEWLWFAVILLIPFTGSFYPHAICAEDKEIGTVNTQADMVNLEYALYYVGKEAECHFTLEQVSDQSLPQIEKAATADLKADSVEQLAQELAQRIENFHFVQNEKNPRVIHVIEKRLAQVPKYAVEQRISLKFSDTLGQLSNALGKKLPNIGERWGGDWRQAFNDHVTEVTIDVKDEKIRDILTDCSDWKEYNPIIWRAETALDTGKTTVQYYWPKDWHRNRAIVPQ